MTPKGNDRIESRLTIKRGEQDGDERPTVKDDSTFPYLPLTRASDAPAGVCPAVARRRPEQVVRRNSLKRDVLVQASTSHGRTASQLPVLVLRTCYHLPEQEDITAHRCGEGRNLAHLAASRRGKGRSTQLAFGRSLVFPVLSLFSPD